MKRARQRDSKRNKGPPCLQTIGYSAVYVGKTHRGDINSLDPPPVTLLSTRWNQQNVVFTTSNYVKCTHTQPGNVFTWSAFVLSQHSAHTPENADSLDPSAATFTATRKKKNVSRQKH